MDVSHDYITSLILEELNGTISAQNKKLLHEAIQVDPTVNRLWKEMMQVLNTDEVAGNIHTLQATLSQQQIKVFVARRRRRGKRIFMLSAGIAACLLIAVSVIVFKISHQKPTISPNSISLQLETGEEIDLSGNNTVQIDHFTLSNTNNMLVIPTGLPNTLATLKVPAGKDYKLTLPDGSLIWINAATTVNFPLAFSREKREVRINGEAYVDVTQNSVTPFYVQLTGSTIKVLGTSFNVNTYDAAHVKVALISGAIQLDAGNISKLVKPGEEYTINVNAGTINNDIFDEDKVLSWTKGLYLYHNTPIKELGEAITRWYGVDVIIDNPKLESRPVTGYISKDETLEEFLTNLEFTSNIKAVLQEGEVHIK